jgi:hypothetical protein
MNKLSQPLAISMSLELVPRNSASDQWQHHVQYYRLQQGTPGHLYITDAQQKCC